MARTSETAIGIAVLRILAGSPNGEATVEQLAAKLPVQLALTAAAESKGDVAIVPDDNWRQRIDGLRLNEGAAGNIFRDNYLIRATRGEWRITPIGHKHVAALS